MNKIWNMIVGLAGRVLPLLDKLAFLPLFGMRLWIGNVFFQSGLTKTANWDTTLALFADEYRVPILPTELAAQLSTGVELLAPVLLVLGLGTRVGAAALLFMTAVIEFTYMSFPVHQAWALMLLTLLFIGAGPLSLDAVIRKKILKK